MYGTWCKWDYVCHENYWEESNLCCLTYWYLFQRWNNYGFKWTWDIVVQNWLVPSNLVTQWYTSWVFYSHLTNWLDDANVVNLWWWSVNDDTYNVNNRTWKVGNANVRQWPCPHGFHVPSHWEIDKILNMIWDVAVIRDQLLIPFAGRRVPDELGSVDALDSRAYLWISSPYSTTSFSRNLSLEGGVGGLSRYGRWIASSIRCVYNNYDVYPEISWYTFHELLDSYEENLQSFQNIIQEYNEAFSNHEVAIMNVQEALQNLNDAEVVVEMAQANLEGPADVLDDVYRNLAEATYIKQGLVNTFAGQINTAFENMKTMYIELFITLNNLLQTELSESELDEMYIGSLSMIIDSLNYRINNNNVNVIKDRALADLNNALNVFLDWNNSFFDATFEIIYDIPDPANVEVLESIMYRALNTFNNVSLSLRNGYLSYSGSIQEAEINIVHAQDYVSDAQAAYNVAEAAYNDAQAAYNIAEVAYNDAQAACNLAENALANAEDHLNMEWSALLDMEEILKGAWFLSGELFESDYFTPTDNSYTINIGERQYTNIPLITSISVNDAVFVLWEQVVWNVNINFGVTDSVTFGKLMEVKIPVEWSNNVVVKVKHAWSNEYNFDWLTTNASASCDANWRPTSNQYNWTPITVVDWFASIYTCEASSFIALGIPPVEVQINLSILKWILTIWVETWNLNLWQVNVSNSAQELSWSFGANSFWVEDMKWVESWYYTTVSVTDLTWSVASHVIPANNIYLKTAWNEPSYISWATVSDSKVVFSNDIKSWHNNLAEPVTYFNRQNTATAEAWRVWKWWDNLQIKVNIPAHTPYDTYRWTITYTLYDLDS